MKEKPIFEDAKKYFPKPKTIKEANINSPNIYNEARRDPVKYWEKAANELEWYKKWDRVLDDRKKPFFKWFVNAKCNIIHNAIDRHLENGNKNKTAIVFESESGEKKTYTYTQLNEEVCRFANVLKSFGIKKGDKVTTYLPNTPEQAITMLACAKIGAVHSVVYAGFSATALEGRIKDARSKIVVTVDESYRKGKKIPLVDTVRMALRKTRTIRRTIVVKRTNKPLKNREVSWKEEMKKAGKTCETRIMSSEDPLFILYTSGTTGKPKGVVHVHGGYMVGVSRTLKWVFDIKDNDVFWCTADPGWITGHSYIVYGPLMLGTTTVLHEGVPTYPKPDVWWEMIEKHNITIFYTAPTVVRALMGLGDEWADKHKMKSLRLLGSVGEPINPEAWKWYFKHVGKNRCPIMDTWWQTETGSFMITPLPILPLKPGSATRPFPGIEADVVDLKGRPQPPGKGGFLVILKPWPSMLRTVYGNPKRYLETYWKKIKGVYCRGRRPRLSGVHISGRSRSRDDTYRRP